MLLTPAWNPLWNYAQTTRTPASTPAPAKRTIAVNVNDIKGTTVRHYRTIGAGRVGEGRYADWQKQLKLCHEELGIDSQRCHGLLHDELGVYREDAKGNPIYNFQYIDMVYDYLLAIGVRLFVEFGFMPDTQQQPNNTLFRTVRPARHAQDVTLLLEGLKPGRYQLSLYGVGYEKNDTYTAYLKMGAPEALTAAQVEALKAKTTDLPERRQEQINIPQSGKWESHFPLRTEDVVLIELKPN